jgi:imidazolonepropionase-like amidohydrolase
VSFPGAGCLILVATTSLFGGDPAPAVDTAPLPAEHLLQIQARELWTAAGKRVPDGLLVVADGRIRSIGGTRDLDPAQPWIRHDGIVTAGLVACQTRSGATDELQDDTRSVLGQARAVYAVDPTSSDFPRALSSGITALGFAPGPSNLVGGLACVIKTAGGRVLEPEAALALSLSGSALGRSTAQSGFLFGASGPEAGFLAEPDGGPETSSRTMRGTREPTSYAGAVAMLEQLFARGQGPFGRVRRKELPVTIQAWDRHEVLRAAQFAKEHGLRGAIRGAPLAGDPDVLAALRASELGVIVGPYSAQQTRPSLESVRLLAEAGVPVAFALDAPENSPEELRLTAARALWAGATRDAVWKALTEDAARLTGAKSIGTLAPGQDADFVLWSGDPLDLSSKVVAVYVDGKRVWAARSER